MERKVRLRFDRICSSSDRLTVGKQYYVSDSFNDLWGLLYPFDLEKVTFGHQYGKVGSDSEILFDTEGKKHLFWQPAIPDNAKRSKYIAYLMPYAGWFGLKVMLRGAVDAQEINTICSTPSVFGGGVMFDGYAVSMSNFVKKYRWVNGDGTLGEPCGVRTDVDTTGWDFSYPSDFGKPCGFMAVIGKVRYWISPSMSIWHRDVYECLTEPVWEASARLVGKGGHKERILLSGHSCSDCLEAVRKELK